MLLKIIAGVDLGALSFVILLAIPLLFDKIPPNSFYGARLQKSFESADCWYKINRYAAKQMIGWAGTSILVALVVLVAPQPSRPVVSNILLAIVTALAVVATVGATICTWFYAKGL